MQNPLLTAQGNIVDLTRIEFDLLDGGQIRCTWWSGGRRVQTTNVQPGREAEICESTRLLLQSMRELKSQRRRGF